MKEDFCDCWDMETPSLPLIGDDAPAFEAVTTNGPMNFPADYKGKWVILFLTLRILPGLYDGIMAFETMIGV